MHLIEFRTLIASFIQFCHHLSQGIQNPFENWGTFTTFVALYRHTVYPKAPNKALLGEVFYLKANQ